MATSTTATKTTQTDLLAIQSLASNSVVISSALDVSTKLAAMAYCRMGRRAATALTTGLIIRIEATPDSSGDNHWYPMAQFQSAIAAASDEAVSGTVSAGTNVITVASTTGLVAGDIIFIDNSTIGNSEWGRIKSISANVSVTIEDNLVNAQTGSTMYDQAEIYPPVLLDLAGVSRIRAVADGSGTGQAVAVNVELVTLDSLATA